MSPEQCRAARAWLELSQQELAEIAHVGLSTVRDYEAGRRQPVHNNLAAILQVFESRGVSFFEEEETGATGIRVANADRPAA
jgi:DNA-binding transcriptional regulator YiaG